MTRIRPAAGPKRSKKIISGIKRHKKEKPLDLPGVLVRETGLEPASTYVHMNLNHARLPIPPFPQKMVGRGGFEPPKLIAADLQSAPFGHSGTYPYKFPS